MGKDIISEIRNLRDLRSRYENYLSLPFMDSAIEAYHNWYEQSCILFSRFFDDSCREYVNFSSVDNEGANGYVLKDNYQKIRKDFCILVDKIERGEYPQASNRTSGSGITAAGPDVTGKKIFISHASEDQELIDRFVDSILLLGMNIDSASIAYTSREDTGVTPGDNIPQFIQNNIACASIVLLMISDNYKASEVCMNEMGAAWALKKNMVQILLPDTSFNKLGWLGSLEKAIRINDPDSLDSLCDKFANDLDIRVKLSEWNRNKNAFTNLCSSDKHTDMSLALVPSADLGPTQEDEELGFFDYRERFEHSSTMVNSICGKLTNGLNVSHVEISKNTKRLSQINPHNPSASQVKAIAKMMAKTMNDLADIEAQNAPLLQVYFLSMIDEVIMMRKTGGYDGDYDSDFEVIKDLVLSVSGAKAAIIELKNVIDTLPSAESTFIKARKRLSKMQDVLIDVLDTCLNKSKELLVAL